ncbi:MAG: ATP synthase F1 subunit delta [Actinomycetota bacterium]|nr:ATP synthase F1 subunit delta [Actinomycetota bacterium]
MAVAQRMYARALVEAAKERDRLDDVREQLGDFVASVREVPELRELLRNPQVDPRAKVSILEGLLGESDELVRNFLLLLAERGRAAEIDEVHREFERLVAEEEGRIEVELTTAVELSDDEAREIVGQIERASGRRVEATRRVDPRLIGGIVLQAGSLRIDASVRGRLDHLRRELTGTR